MYFHQVSFFAIAHITNMSLTAKKEMDENLLLIFRALWSDSPGDTVANYQIPV
jgi:hypothetical protein